MQERWIGETWLEIKPESRPAKTRKSMISQTTTGQKRKSENADRDDVQDDEPKDDDVVPDEGLDQQPDGQDRVLPQVPGMSPLTTALRDRGANAVDGIRRNPAVGTSCPIESCHLPGGHAGPHEDEDGSRFTWSAQYGRMQVDAADVAIESSSSSDSEELVPDVKPEERGVPSQTISMIAPQKDSFYAFEVSITPSDLNFLNANPEKSAIWLSRKMQEKGKEARWSQLSMDQKKNYDISQAKELSNVLSSRALRSLTSQEWDNLDYSKVMSMRWVLTTKNDGSTKARLVVLGFQMAGIGEVQTAAPTMARVSRNLLLTICANNRFKLRAGDVTAAFLQTSESLEDLDLTVCAPAELAVAFGANPENPVMPLRISKAFYGLVRSPRCWYNDVSSKMQRQGWKCILADRCLFVLYDEEPTSSTFGQIIGIAGLHVDDFLVGGIEEHPRYAKAFADLQSTYNWGKWQSDQFEFAGCHITQLPDSSIRIDQEDYVTKWVDEIQPPKDRMTQTSSALTPREISMLRGAIGSLSWKSAQTGPHFQAETCLLLSEVPHATISTIVKVNKLIREVKREASQSLLFPAWGVEWHKMAIVTWCDAGEKNRPDKSSTLGHITGIAPAGFLQGEPHVVAI